MENLQGSVWFEGSDEIKCNLQKVTSTLEYLPEHFVGVIKLMPGMTGVEVVEQGSDFVTIKTNEGLIKRTSISKRIESERVFLEFEEDYQAVQMVRIRSHFLDEFTSSDAGVRHRAIISNVKARGWMGFFYRKFGSLKTGNAYLNSYKSYLES